MKMITVKIILDENVIYTSNIKPELSLPTDGNKISFNYLEENSIESVCFI